MNKQRRNSVFNAYLTNFWSKYGKLPVLFVVFALVLQLTGVFLYTRGSADAATSSTLNFQARLLGSAGSVVPDGTYNLEFKLYDVASGGTALWTDTRYDQNGGTAGLDYRLTVKAGYFSVNLADTTVGGTAFPSTINWDQELWLGLNVGGTAQTATPTWDGEMTPRFKLTAVPFAFQAATALGVASNNTNAVSTNSGNITIQSGNAAGATSNSGNITIDAGTATGTAGTVSLGATNASALTLGRSGITTTLQGSVTLSGGTNYGVYYRDGSGNIVTTAAGTTNECFRATTGAAPSWGSCSGTGDIIQGGNSFTAAMTIGTNDNFDVNIETNGTTKLTVQADGDLVVDTNTLFVDATTNRVGIGSTAPQATLEVVGDIISSGTSWTARTSAADNTWTSIAYGNGLFVATAADGSGANDIMTSPDGINWTIRSAVDNNWRAVTYGNGLFVAVSNSGANRVMTSPDGITWTARTAAAAQTWESVTYGNGTFVAVASDGAVGVQVMTSTDGISWVSQTSAAANVWTAVTYGNGTFVAVSGSGTVMTSPTGTTWTTQTAAAGNQWNAVTYGNGLFVATSVSGTGNRVMTSPNGTSWTARTSAADLAWYGVTYGDGLFVAVAGDAVSGNAVMTSANGIDWVTRTSPNNNAYIEVAYGNGVFASVAQTGTGNRAMSSGKNSLKPVSDNNIYQGGLTIYGGLTAASGVANINASSNFATNINTGTSTGAVAIGNSAAGTITVQSASTIGLTGTTSVTGLSAGAGTALTVNNSTSTGSIFVAQDNGSAVFTIADGGAATFTSTLAVNTLGTTDTSTYLCRNTSNQIAGCSGTPLTNSLTDNIADAFDLQEGINNYFNINTTNGAEVMAFGSTAINPDFSFLGSGDFTVRSNVTSFQNTADSTASLTVKNAAGTNVIQVDTSNGRIAVGGDVGGFSGTPTKLTNPATMPNNVGRATAFSPDSTYAAIATDGGTPYIYIYKRSGDTFTKLADPATLPASNAQGVSWSPDGTYLVVGHETSPYITIYKRSGDTFTKLTNPSNLPTGTSRGSGWSADGTYLTIAHTNSPYFTAYKRSGDTFTKLADPATLPTNTAYTATWSPDGTYLSVGQSTTPYVFIYKRSGDTLTKLSDPATLPGGTVVGTSWSPNGVYLTTANRGGTPYITIYKRSGDTFTKLSDPATMPTGPSGGVSWTADSNYLAVAHDTSPFVTFYSRSGDTFTKLSNPATLPGQNASGVSFSAEGTYASVSMEASPYFALYKSSGGPANRIELLASVNQNDGIGFGKEIQLYRSATNVLSLGAGSNFRLENGSLIVNEGSLQVTNGTTTLGGALSVSGLTTLTTLGSADTSTYLCRNSSNQVATCSGTPLTNSLTDNIADAFDLQEGTNNYVNIRTSNGTENISFGNATTNPSFNFLGTGTLAVAGSQTVGGTLQVTGNVTAQANLTVGSGAGVGLFTNNGATLNSTLSVANDADGGPLGAGLAASASVDVYTAIAINQTTASQTITLPSPTVATAGRVLYISNVGSASFTLLGTTVNTGTTATLFWNGTAWTFAGADGNGILNQNASAQTANFRISGSGQADTGFIAPSLERATAGTLSVGTTANTTGLTVGGSSLTGTLAIESGAAGTINIGQSASARTINVGTGAAAQTVTVGSTNGASALTLQSGTGALNIQTQGTGGLNIGTNAVAQTVTIGNGTGATSVVINAGTGAINVGTNAVARTITIGNTTGASALTLNSGTGAINIGTGAQARTTSIATGGAVQTVTLGSTNTTSTTTIAAGSGNLNFNASQAQFSEVTGTRTLTVQTRTTNVAGSALTISGGTAGTGASAFTGGALTLQGGNAAGTGNANGANVILRGGTGVGTGVSGIVEIDTPVFTAAATQSFGTSGTITQSVVDGNSTIPIDATAGSLTITLPSPTVTTVGRIIYVTAVSASNSFTMSPSGGTAFVMGANTTATFVWNGSAWTNAGVDGGSSSYIQNQNATDQTGNFRISGTGRAAVALQAPLLDTATATALNIGTTNATSIVLDKNTSLSGSTTFTTGTGLTTASGALTVTGLTTLNGDLTVQTGDTFTFNGDAFTDFTGGGLVNTAGVLTVDTASGTGFIQNQNAADQTGNVRISGTVRANTSVTTPLVDSISGGLNVGTSSATSVTVGSNTNNSSVTIDSGTGAISIGTGAQARTTNIATGAAAQTLTVGSTNTTSTTTIQAGSGGITLTGATTASSTLVVTGLATLNGGLTVEAGDTFTFNSDAFTDFTGGGLVNTGGVLTVDNSSASGYFQNGGNSFGAAATLGTNDANVLNFETGGTTQLTVTTAGNLEFNGAGTLTNTSGDLTIQGATKLELKSAAGNSAGIVLNNYIDSFVEIRQSADTNGTPGARADSNWFNIIGSFYDASRTVSGGSSPGELQYELNQYVVTEGYTGRQGSAVLKVALTNLYEPLAINQLIREAVPIRVVLDDNANTLGNLALIDDLVVVEKPGLIGLRPTSTTLTGDYQFLNVVQSGGSNARFAAQLQNNDDTIFLSGDGTGAASERLRLLAAGGVTLTGNTTVASGNLVVDSADNTFNVDASGNRVGIGTTGGTGKLTVTGATSALILAESTGANNAYVTIKAPASQQAGILFNTDNTDRFQLGVQTDNSLFLYDSANSRDAANLSGGNLTLNGVGGNVTIGNTAGTSAVNINSGSGGINLNTNTTIGNATTDRLTVTSQILGATPFAFQGTTDNGFTTSFAITDPTANNTITFPDASGTVLLGASGSGNGLVQVPTSNTAGAQGANYIAPTAASIVGLKVVRTTGTANNALQVNTPTIADTTAQVFINTGATGQEGLVIERVAGQTANILDVRNESGASLAYVAASGNVVTEGEFISQYSVRSSDAATASNAFTVRSGNTTGGTGLSTGSLTLQSGNGSGTNTSSGNVIIDAGSVTGTGTRGAISVGTTNAASLTLGRTGITTTNNGALTVAQNLTVDSVDNVLVVDVTGNRVGIGNTGSTGKLSVSGATSALGLFESTGANNAYVTINAPTSQQAGIQFSTNGSTRFQFGAQSDNSFFLYDNANARDALQITTAGTVRVNPTGGNVEIGNTAGTTAVTINSGTGAISIGTGAQARTTNIATGGAQQTVTVGSQNGASTLTLDSGTGAISIGTGAQARTTNIATGGAVQTVTLGSTNTTSATTIAAGSGAITFNASAAQFSEVTGTRTLTVQTRTTAATAGTALTIQAGSAAASGAATTGGALTLQGGSANGASAAANGGNVVIAGGTGFGTGVKGLVVLDTTTYSAATVQNFTANANITQANVDTFGSILISGNVAGWVATLPDPTQTTTGRVVYITNSGTFDITLAANTVGTALSITLKPASTATMFWNGSDWTAAGASSSTDLQAAYNNTATSAGGAELVLNASGGAADGLTVRNNATSPIIGGIFEAQTGVGSNIFSVNNNATEFAVNGGAETSTNFSTNWLAGPAGGTVARNTSSPSTNVATGQAAVSVVTTATAAHGARNILSATLTPNLKYNVSYTVRSSAASGSFTALETMFSSDGTATAGNVRACVAGTPTYFTGTASQSTTTITGVGTTWTAGMVGQILVFSNGASALITGFTNATTLTTSAAYSQTVTARSYNMYNAGNTVNAGAWSRVSCTFIAPASGMSANNSVFIRQTDATARTFYIDNLSVTVSADVNHAIDGSVDDSTNFATNWTAGIAGGTVARNTSILYDTSASASVITSPVANHGIRNNLGITPAINTQYLVTFYARSSVAFTDIRVRYTRDGGTNFVSCGDYNTQNVSTTGFTKITCLLTTDGTIASNPDLVIEQTTGVARTFYVDALSMTLNTNNSNNVQIGAGSKGGPVTLFTLDRAASSPIAANNDAYLGSMYYDTTSGRIQCYEADGWGACGSAPDNYVNLNPEYAGAVLNGSGVGTMTADFCANQSGVLQVNTTLCATGESRNFYKWTSPQATSQTYSIYVSYQLPATFKGFSSDDTVQLTARTSSTTDGSVSYEMFKSESGALTACGTATTVTSIVDTWQTVGINGNEATSCNFSTASANAFVIFKINVTADSNANVYVGTLSFTTTGR